MIKKPCRVCGHGKKAHFSHRCVDCFTEYCLINDEVSVEYDHKYKLDNLRYLEGLSKQD
jgi:hypothetical protein